MEKGREEAPNIDSVTGEDKNAYKNSGQMEFFVSHGVVGILRNELTLMDSGSKELLDSLSLPCRNLLLLLRGNRAGSVQ